MFEILKQILHNRQSSINHQSINHQKNMKKTLGYIILLLCCFSSFAQNGITLKGKILKDKTQSPIESANYLFDSSQRLFGGRLYDFRQKRIFQRC
jgi:hypothetical protein